MNVRWLEPAARVLAAGAVLGAILWFVPARGLPLDDAWIHQVVGRTFAETGTLGYAPGQHGSAATSYLWAALLASNFAFFHLAPETWALVLNTLAAIATVDLLYRIVARVALGPGWRAFALVVSLGATVSANVLWFVGSGMESMPLVALALGAIELATGTESLSLRRALGAGALAGALAVLRPDAICFGPLLLCYLAARDRRRTTVLAAVLVPWLVAVGLYAGSNLLKTGHVLPSTLAGRRWLWFASSEGLAWPARVAWFLDEWAKRLGSFTVDTSLTVAWLLVGVALYGGYRLVRATGRAADGARCLLGWAFFHGAFYAAMLPTPGHGGRYQPLVPLLFALLLPVGAALALARLVPPRLFALAALAGVVPFAILGAGTASALRGANILAIDHIRNTEIAAGKYVATLPEGAVASFDIGGTGIASTRRILDLGGLSDAETATLLASGRIAEWIDRKDVRFVVIPDNGEAELPFFDSYVRRLHLDRPDLRLVPLRIFETPLPEWGPGIRATWNAAPRQVVYRVERTSPIPSRPTEPVPESARRTVGDRAGLVTAEDRTIAEHMLGVLAARGIEASIDVTPLDVPVPSSAACRFRIGPWGVAVDGCPGLDHELLRTTAWAWAGRYLDVGDFGGAVRILPHVVVATRRRIEPFFEAPLATVNAPVPGGNHPPANGIARGGAWYVLGALAGLLVLDAARRLRARFGIVAACLALLGCKPGVPGLDGAIDRGRGATLEALDRGAEVEPANPGGGSPLFTAANHGDVEIVSLLLDRGARPGRRLRDGSFPLHLAARRGHAGVVAALLARSSEGLDAPAGIRRRTPLHDAAAAGSLETVRVLLASGAKPDPVDGFGQTPLHLLAPLDARAAPIASLLLGAGAKRDLADQRGFSPLHAAAFTNAAPLLRVLGGEGAPLEQRTPAGETALDLALHHDRPEAAEVLLAAGAALGADVAPPLHEAARVDRTATIASLLVLGADVRRLYHGKTALEIAHDAGSVGAEGLLRERAR